MILMNSAISPTPFFEHGSMVYHLWLDCDLLDEETFHEIKSTVFAE